MSSGFTYGRATNGGELGESRWEKGWAAKVWRKTTRGMRVSPGREHDTKGVKFNSLQPTQGSGGMECKSKLEVDAVVSLPDVSGCFSSHGLYCK